MMMQQGVCLLGSMLTDSTLDEPSLPATNGVTL
jgi:hypothetical protein